MTVNIYIFISSLCTITIFSVSIIIYLFLHPEVVEKWGALTYRIVYFITKHGSKKIVKYDIQGRVNEFSKILGKEIANYEPVGINIEWIKTDETPTEFFKNDKLVIRMRHHDDQDRNFIIAAMVFISKSILTKAKKYLSSSQKESIDLFLGKKLCQREKPRVEEKFFDYYFAPKTDASERIKELLGKYEIIDKVGMFYAVLVQELNFLGEKVFSQARSNKIVEEVTHLINFLERYANREIGDDTVKMQFEGKYCRCGIAIIAKAFKTEIGDTGPYLKYIKTLIDRKIENIYLLGPAKELNQRFIEKIALGAQESYGYLEYFSKRYKAKIKREDERVEIANFLVLIRSPEVVKFYDREMEAKLFGDCEEPKGDL